MNLKLHHRCFPGSSFRPTPAVSHSKRHVSIVTPWSTNIETAQKIIQFFEEAYQVLSKDQDSTVPFPQMQSLSVHENHIRTALLKLNEHIFSQYNQEKLTLGFEAVFIVRTMTQMIFAQIGHPQVYLSRQDLALQPIGPAFTLSSSFSQKSTRLPPLPQTLLGVFPDAPIWIHSVKIQPKDHIILVSRNFIPSSFFTEKNKSFTSLSQILAQDCESEPFWLGQIEL